MSDFPLLKTGAVAQYPASRAIEFSTHVTEFVDGSTQRHRDQAQGLRRWVIRLEALEEGELRQIERFFVEQQGRYGSFRFVDPWDGVAYADCSFEDDVEWSELTREGAGRTSVTIRQNRG